MERIDLYLDEFQPSGESINRGEAIPEDRYAMIVFACIFNAEGKLLIQQRSWQKLGWAGRWDVSAAGAASAGENSRLAVAREVKEELGLDLPAEDYIKMLTLYYETSMHDIFAVEWNGDIESLQIQKEEVESIRWASKEEVLTMIDQGEFVPVYKEYIEFMFRMGLKRGIM